MLSEGQFGCRDYAFELFGDRAVLDELVPILRDLAIASVAGAHRWRVELFGGHARLHIDDTEDGDWVRRDELAAEVVSRYSRALIDAQTDRLHLHSAAVVSSGRVLLVAGPSGSGKSTLTTALVAAGAEYGSDEAVAVRLDGGDVVTVPKPISVKSGGIALVERLTGLRCPPGATSWEIPASRFGTLASGSGGLVATLVFPTSAVPGPPRLEPVHRATAVRRLLADSQDAQRLGPAALSAVARLVGRARCLDVVAGSPEAVARTLLDVHRSPAEPGEVTMVPAASGRHTPRRARDVASVVIDARAVLFTGEPHRVVELDVAHTAWWLLLDGAPLGQIFGEVVAATGRHRDDVIATMDQLLGDLAVLGVLEGGQVLASG